MVLKKETIETWNVLQRLIQLTRRETRAQDVPERKAESPFFQTSSTILLSVAFLSAYPWKSRTGSLRTMRPTNSPGSPKREMTTVKKTETSALVRTPPSKLIWRPSERLRKSPCSKFNKGLIPRQTRGPTLRLGCQVPRSSPRLSSKRTLEEGRKVYLACIECRGLSRLWEAFQFLHRSWSSNTDRSSAAEQTRIQSLPVCRPYWLKRKIIMHHMLSAVNFLRCRIILAIVR